MYVATNSSIHISSHPPAHQPINQPPVSLSFLLHQTGINHVRAQGEVFTWQVLVFMAITAFTGTISTITATPANTGGPRLCKGKKHHTHSLIQLIRTAMIQIAFTPALRSEDETSSHLPEEVKRQDDLKRCRPDHIDVRDQVHEALCVYRHEVYDFSHCRCAASSVRNHQRLKKNPANQKGYTVKYQNVFFFF